MLKKSSNSIKTIKAAAEYFTGDAWIETLVKSENVSCNVVRVTFEPAARNNWHTHPVGQILIVSGGKGYVQKKGEAIQLLLPGDVVTILADEEHWHGAAPDSIFTHIAIQLLSEKGEETRWLNTVTDVEYNSFQTPV